MSTDRYTPRPRDPWKRCTRCGAEGPDVAGEPALCRHTARCDAAKQLLRPQNVFYPRWVTPAPRVDERPWEELELGKVATA